MFLLFHYTSKQEETRIWKIENERNEKQTKFFAKQVSPKYNVFLNFSPLSKHFISVLEIHYPKYPRLNNPRADLILRQLYIRLFLPFFENKICTLFDHVAMLIN